MHDFKEIQHIGKGSVHDVSLVEHDGRKVVVAMTHSTYPWEKAIQIQDLECQEYRRCQEFFSKLPEMVVSQTWLPIETEAGSEPCKVCSVREWVNPLKPGQYESSSLGEKGLRSEELDVVMQNQVREAIEVMKMGITEAVTSREEDLNSYVPDIRGENFIFDENRNLRFVDTGSLENCGLNENRVMSSGLESTIFKMAFLERRYLGKKSEQLMADTFYTGCLKMLIDRVGMAKTSEKFSIIYRD